MIERVTYHQEESGFSVLRVAVKGERDLVTLIGNLPGVTPGEWVVARGAWVQNREHGRQFRAVELRSSAPGSREGIEGIGPDRRHKKGGIPKDTPSGNPIKQIQFAQA